MLILAASLLSVCSALLPLYRVSDSAGLGREFDGIGGLSGGGATSKLLVSYPSKLRDEILDYLFLPNFGASLQILKVEIGGDDQSSDGSESSHMHEEWEENYQRGYEWWLMKEAKKRNPSIKLYGLSWAWPGWLGVQGNPYLDLEKTAKYTVNWIAGAKRVHNLTIDYIGIWNEKPASSDYILFLRQALNRSGLMDVKIIAPDGGFEDFLIYKSNQSLSQAVYAYGVHYPGTYSPISAEIAKTRLWSSEDYSTFNDDIGAGCWARLLNRNYVNGFFTSTIAWNLIASYYPRLPWYRNGLMTAMEPWSGHYEVNNPIWISAHTTQFTEIGWRYLSHVSGVGHLVKGGTYASLTDPDKKHLSIIIETMSHNNSICVRPPLAPYSVAKQKAVFKLGGAFGGIKSLYHWRTTLKFDGSATTAFEKLGSVQIRDRKFEVDLGIDEIHTFSTISTARKGSNPPSPLQAPFPVPYKDDFNAGSEYSEPQLLAQQSGSWEIISEGAENKFARQTTLNRPLAWCDQEKKATSAPFAIIGNSSWENIGVEVEVRIPKVNGTEAVFVGVHAGSPGCDPPDASGLFLWLHPNSTSFAITSDIKLLKIFALGNSATAFEIGSWLKLKLNVKDKILRAWVGSEQVTSFPVPKMAQKNCAQEMCFVALGSYNFGYSEWDNLHIFSPNN